MGRGLGRRGRQGEEVEVSAAQATTAVRGKLKADAPLAPLVWFKSGGNAELLFEPADRDDLVKFLKELDLDTPVMALGLGSNMIVRDGGVPGVTVRLGKAFAKIERLDDVALKCGGGASGILVARYSGHRRRVRPNERRRLWSRGSGHSRQLHAGA
jgi:UDP-N-acetylmuramate dehydrogenase